MPNRGDPNDPAPVFPTKDVKDEIVELGGADGEKTCQETSFSTMVAALMKSATAIDASRRATGLTISLPCVPNCRTSWRSSSHE